MENIENDASDSNALSGKLYVSLGLIALIIAFLPRWTVAVDAFVYNHSEEISMAALTSILSSWISPRFYKDDTGELFGYVFLLAGLVCLSWMNGIIHPPPTIR